MSNAHTISPRSSDSRLVAPSAERDARRSVYFPLKGPLHLFEKQSAFPLSACNVLTATHNKNHMFVAGRWYLGCELSLSDNLKDFELRLGYIVMIFRDRRAAGKYLAKKLHHYANRDDVLVLALPRGGVPVAYEVASSLKAPLDIFLVRKLGVPGHEEMAMGAIASGGVRVLNDEVVDYLGIPDSVIDAMTQRELQELKRREKAYRGDRPEPDVTGKTVILIDDGLATGSTIRAAAQALTKQQPARIVVAVPVSAPQSCDEYWIGVDEIVCAYTPEPFLGVGQWYLDFSQTTDDEVRDLLERARHAEPEKGELIHS